MTKNADRLQYFTQNYARTDLAQRPFIRFEAVNGAKLGDKIHDMVSAKVWLGLHFLKTAKVRLGDQQLTHGMIGCYLSHYAIWEQATKPYTIVFEDDAVVYPAIYKSVIRYIVEEPGPFPADWDIILLGHHCIGCTGGNTFYKHPKNFWGTHGYIISRKGRETMMKWREPEMTLQIDGLMAQLGRQGVLKIYAIHPSYVSVANFGSDIQLKPKHVK